MGKTERQYLKNKNTKRSTASPAQPESSLSSFAPAVELQKYIYYIYIYIYIMEIRKRNTQLYTTGTILCWEGGAVLLQPFRTRSVKGNAKRSRESATICMGTASSRQSSGYSPSPVPLPSTRLVGLREAPAPHYLGVIHFQPDLCLIKTHLKRNLPNKYKPK